MLSLGDFGYLQMSAVLFRRYSVFLRNKKMVVFIVAVITFKRGSNVN